MRKIILIIVIMLLQSTQLVFAGLELSNGQKTLPLGNGDTSTPVEEVESMSVTIQEIQNIEENTEKPPEIEQEEYIRTDEVIKINLNVALIGIIIGLIIIVIGSILLIKVDNPYDLENVIIIKDKTITKLYDYKDKKEVSQRIPCQGDIFIMYLLGLQSCLLVKDAIYDLISDSEEYRYILDEDNSEELINKHLREAITKLKKSGKIVYSSRHKKVSAYKPKKFCIEDIKGLIAYINYLEFAQRNNKFKEDDKKYISLLDNLR